MNVNVGLLGERGGSKEQQAGDEALLREMAAFVTSHALPVLLQVPTAPTGGVVCVCVTRVSGCVCVRITRVSGCVCVCVTCAVVTGLWVA